MAHLSIILLEPGKKGYAAIVCFGTHDIWKYTQPKACQVLLNGPTDDISCVRVYVITKEAYQRPASIAGSRKGLRSAPYSALVLACVRRLLVHEKRSISLDLEDACVRSRNCNAPLNISDVVCSKAVPGAKAILMARTVSEWKL